MMEKGCGLARWCAGRARPRRNEALALRLLTGELSGAANGFRLLAGALLGRLFVIVAEFHLAEDAFALHLFLQRPERLIHIVIANDDLHAHYSPFQRLRKLEWPKPFPVATSGHPSVIALTKEPRIVQTVRKVASTYNILPHTPPCAGHSQRAWLGQARPMVGTSPAMDK